MTSVKKASLLTPIVLFLHFLIFGSLNAQDYLEDKNVVVKLLEEEKDEYKNKIQQGSETAYMDAKRLLDLDGLSIKDIGESSFLTQPEKAALKAYYYWKINDFFKAEKEIDKLSKEAQKNVQVQYIKALLAVEAWDLEEAKTTLTQALKKSSDLELELLLGRTLMLQKNYSEALKIAVRLLDEDPNRAEGYFLKAEIHFWDQEPKPAEEALVKGLSLDPLNADARFYYGYAIWRRIDATQLDDMVAQWEIALAINPLHFQSHWHLGNGHTNKTFADYADPNEEMIRNALKEADENFSEGNLEAAFKIIDKVAIDFPNSVLPQMHKASLLYSDFEATNRFDNLSAAEELFLEILEQKEHYGPAHNGLAAVIKSKRIPYLNIYSSTLNHLRNPKIENEEDMTEIFPDVSYYPDNSVKGMVWNQLYTSVAYFPFLAELKREFVIPPLHEDLALAMNNSYFRYNTTFDNRQWMDIRGVGSGAADIGYVERGAFGERNVLLHEYVHLFHGTVLTDQQNREIKQLYYHAMENRLTLDYYSQNNESEYFAQTYPAYFEAVKVHPLDFKSMNTTADLKSKDAKMYAFLDDLIKKEKAYLAGNKEVMASNWAQVYLSLAQRSARGDKKAAYAYLNKSLKYDSLYLPSHLYYANLLTQDQRWEEAKDKIKEAKRIDEQYAPIYLTEAELLKASKPENIESQAELYKKAYDLEADYMEQAKNSRTLRNFYFTNGKLADALETADEYVENGAKVSTYLRDSRDEAKAFSAWQRALWGDKDSQGILSELIAQKPHQYGFRLKYAETLLATAQFEEALKVLLPAYRDLEASKVKRPDFELLIAEAYRGMGNHLKADEFRVKMTEEIDGKSVNDPVFQLRAIRFLYTEGQFELGDKLLEQLPKENSVLFKSDKELTKAVRAISRKDDKQGFKYLKSSLELYPYQKVGLEYLNEMAPKNRKAKRFLKQQNDKIRNLDL